MIYLLTAIGLSPGGSSTVHIYTQTIHRTTQNKQYLEQQNNLGDCGSCPVLASYTLAFALQLRKKHGKTSVRVATSKNTRVGTLIVATYLMCICGILCVFVVLLCVFVVSMCICCTLMCICCTMCVLIFSL